MNFIYWTIKARSTRRTHSPSHAGSNSVAIPASLLDLASTFLRDSEIDVDILPHRHHEIQTAGATSSALQKFTWTAVSCAVNRFTVPSIFHQSELRLGNHLKARLLG